MANTHFRIHTLGELEILATALELRLQYSYPRIFGPFDIRSIRFNSIFGSRGFVGKRKWQGGGA